MISNTARNISPSQDPTEASFVRSLFESAGKTLMLLPGAQCWPEGYFSAWPEYAHDFSDFIGRKIDLSAIKMRANPRQLQELELISEWQITLAQYCRMRKMSYVARAVSLAMLHYPNSDKRVYSDRTIGKIMHASDKTVKSWYEQGYRIIANLNALELEANGQ